MSDGRIAIVIADPSQLMLIDEIILLLGKRIVVQVGALVQMSEVLRKLERSARASMKPTAVRRNYHPTILLALSDRVRLSALLSNPNPVRAQVLRRLCQRKSNSEKG
jgi:hypothetical protein